MKSAHIERTAKRLSQLSGVLFLIFLAARLPAAAQLSPTGPDPLARIREAAKTSAQACSATGATLCEQVAPKIIANAQGDSPLAENLRSLVDGLKSQKATPGDAPAVAWALAAFREAGVEAHIEKYLVAPGEAEGAPQDKIVEAEIVVAEIRGREKPDEWVLLGGRLHSSDPGADGADAACNGALVVEAARDIQLTGTRPRRSIRFVLFGGEDQGMTGSWAYVKGHRSELDRAPAAILFEAAANHVDGFALNDRRDIEPGVREALKPIESMGVTDLRFNAPFQIDSLDFLLEGVPTLVAARGKNLKAGRSRPDSLDTIDLNELKHNTAIAAVTAFGIAERAEPLGPRQSRAEIESLLKATDLENQMKIAGVWSLWESGKRGRLP